MRSEGVKLSFHSKRSKQADIFIGRSMIRDLRWAKCVFGISFV